jgi:Phytanoyl-CoA dioxygenase (PhyH)
MKERIWHHTHAIASEDLSMNQAEIPPRISSFPISGAVEQIWADIVTHDLTYHIAELEVKGYTVIPPEKAAPAGFAARLLETAVAVVERRSGIRLRPGMSEQDCSPEMRCAFGHAFVYVLFEDPIFQEALLNPVALAMISYMLGYNALLSDMAILIKGPGGINLPLHADSFRVPDPLPPLPQICNLTWALTDYTEENGALAVVPGSHRYFRRPLDNEGHTERVAVEAKAGSLIAFSGHLWHGAFARVTPGFRATITMYMCRPHLTTQGAYGPQVPQDVIDRHPPRFATLVGRKMNYGWKEVGPATTTDAPESNLMGKHAWD